MRTVIVYKQSRNKETHQLEKHFDYQGKFHQFGVCYDEFEAGPGNYSTALVERDDGTIDSVDVRLIQFVN